jgi:hypothetical protein
MSRQADPNSREHLMSLGVRAILMHLRWDLGLLRGEFGMEGVVVALEASPKSRNCMLLFSPHVTMSPDFQSNSVLHPPKRVGIHDHIRTLPIPPATCDKQRTKRRHAKENHGMTTNIVHSNRLSVVLECDMVIRLHSWTLLMHTP